MKPLPKWVGVLGTVGVVATSVQGMLQDPTIALLLPPKITALAGSLCGLLILLSHSFTGTGGK